MFIGTRLKKLRKEKGLTQTELGDMLNVTKVSVCCYEKGVRVPSLETLEDISRIFGVSCDYFLGNDVSCVREDTPDYSFYISNEEMNFLKLLRLNTGLYNKMNNDPKRMIELIDKKLK